VTLHQLLDLTLAAAENGTGNNKANWLRQHDYRNES
jgi:hypothetical protein